MIGVEVGNRNKSMSFLKKGKEKGNILNQMSMLPSIGFLIIYNKDVKTKNAEELCFGKNSLLSLTHFSIFCTIF